MQRIGLDIQRFPEAHPLMPVRKQLDHIGVTHLVDVGANTGQYASEMRRIGYSGKILSVEPLPDACAALASAAATDSNWSYQQVAVGAERGHATLYVSANSVSSSLARMLPQHLRSAPESRVVGETTVEVRTLDEIVSGLPLNTTFIKLDVQGYERQVIEGAPEVFDAVAGAQLELALTPLYEGDLSLTEGVEVMVTHGLSLVAVLPGFSDQTTGQMLQCDGVFARLHQ